MRISDGSSDVCSSDLAAWVEEGQEVFRYDTFGDEIKWTDQLRMNAVISTAVSPVTALAVGLIVDVEALPESVKQGIADGSIDLNDPGVTVAFLRLDAVVGLKGTAEAVHGVYPLSRVVHPWDKWKWIVVGST